MKGIWIFCRNLMDFDFKRKILNWFIRYSYLYEIYSISKFCGRLVICWDDKVDIVLFERFL